MGLIDQNAPAKLDGYAHYHGSEKGGRPESGRKRKDAITSRNCGFTERRQINVVQRHHPRWRRNGELSILYDRSQRRGGPGSR
ncbi:protein of unknown function [Kyrpidia spormannii]|uniref:Uncharacterized protein n=2 Tax=Kyrpidia spormannii TaxID=2055160 RepID=A0ACA8ZE33_9BACL|nr:protein of unknown function [Kyrpidia spormannii]CAB3396354.1 protein of unknown function [Kyrpidia spormannii]